MSKYPSRTAALRILREAGCPEEVIRHSVTVADIATEMVKRVNLRKEADIHLIEIGALLHDLGRSRTRSIEHGVLGAKMAKKLALDERIVSVIENHVGAGIPATEARELGLPFRDFLPWTLEQKIVCYADKLAVKHRKISHKEARKQILKELGPTHPAIRRFEKLFLDIVSLGIKDA